MTIRIEEYLREGGQSPYRDWFDRLNAAYAAKVSVGVLRLSQGNTSGIKWFDGLGELRSIGVRGCVCTLRRTATP